MKGYRQNALQLKLQRIEILIFLFVLFSFQFLFIGCGKQSTDAKKVESAIKTCELPEEQANTLQGRWKKLPIKVSFHNGDFSGEEIGEIVKASQTWNKFFAESKSFEIFDAKETNTSAVVQAAPTCNAGTLADGAVVYKRSSTWTKSKSAVAITTFCFSSSSGGKFKTIFNAILEFNYKDFFVETSGKLPDIQSIALHEFGHLIGLDHSCGALKNNAANVACPDPDADPGNELVQTVMFPKVFFDPNSGLGEEKRSLKANDQGRANCLYDNAAE